MRVEEIGLPDVKIGQHVTVWYRADGQHGFGQGGDVVSVDNAHITVRNPLDTQFTWTPAEIERVTIDAVIPITECIQYDPALCRGTADHFSPTGMGGPIRCDYHIEKRIESYENSVERYANSDVAPSWFDPTYAGEQWDCE